jgi:NTP pyrophosphatase (non-canonical NTP hydrolase)
MINKAEKIAEKGQAYDVESLWDDLKDEFGDRCGWVSQEANKMTQVIESEMAKIREALDE